MLKIILLLMAYITLNANMFKTTKYDLYFMKEYNSQFYFYKDIYNYKIIKAQSMQESRLNPTAKSPVGAYGLMQFMPLTAKQVKKELNITIDKPEAIPELAIKMGVYYDRKLLNGWKSERTEESRYKLMFASYNAGIGHLINAQKLCINKKLEKCNEYGPIESQLEFITGRHATETKTYNKRIFEYYMKLNLL